MLGGILRQATLLYDEIGDRFNAFTAFQIRENERRFPRILTCPLVGGAPIGNERTSRS
jgi:hypothetical protein